MMWHINFFQIEKNNDKIVKENHPKQHIGSYILDPCVRKRVCAAGMLQRHGGRLYPDFQ